MRLNVYIVFFIFASADKNQLANPLRKRKRTVKGREVTAVMFAAKCSHAGRRRVVVVSEVKNHCLKWTTALITLVVVINTNASYVSLLAFIHVNIRHFLKIKHQVLEVCRVMFYLTPVCMCKKKKLLTLFKITLNIYIVTCTW